MNELAALLRTRTRPLHDAVEQLLYTPAMQAGSLTAGQYRHLLRTHYLFHRDLEAAIGRHASQFAGYDPDSRRKTPALLADFHALGETPPTTESVGMQDWLPGALLGAAYVSEGSMLGVTMVGPMLRNNPALAELTDAMHFYAGYGTDTGRNWKAFGQLLADVPGNRYEAVVAGAEAAFRRYQHLFAETKPLSPEE
ncbi:biliverdin-producing heme oxygenase [Spirosoma rhododendri]|uniref:Biliverdin-producing heme oxygenase n=1 Tax=Spirosoma rhododendri TaxID=2728024 RepID=A0A7L5DLM3_9BACT|nr:biliverdin-producing heme oxygenase [Spirosoma rhododendri]QJD79374.1 biliverdin-producing heme oxygenase [Spirosoma rhododendri]